MSIQIKEANRESRNSISIVRSSTGHGFQLKALQFLPYPQDQVFEFFADAFKLQTLTPTWLHFSVVTPPPIRIAAGTLTTRHPRGNAYNACSCTILPDSLLQKMSP
jgi:hypothetical protein